MPATDALLQTPEPVLTREERRQRFTELGWWVSIPLNVVPAHWLYDGEQRLDGRCYAQEAATALRIVRDCGLGVGSGYIVSDMAKLYSAMYHLVTM